MNVSLQQPATSAWSMYRAIVGIGALCALLIVSVYEATAPRIRDNQEQFLRSAVSQVLPAARSNVAVELNSDGQLAATVDISELPAFLGYDAGENLVGAAITAQGMGYQDNVRVLYAYSFDRRAITGMRVLDSKETPGLGDKVETEAHFLANFERLDASLATDGRSLAHPIVTVKQGEKTQPWEIDGITGATITSEAIGSILNESADVWVPVLEREAREFSARPTGGEQ